MTTCCQPGTAQEFDPKPAGSKRCYTYDFTPQIIALPAFTTITSQSVSIAPISGDDPDASDMRVGSADRSGNVIVQWIDDGISGVVYGVTFTANCSDGSVLEETALLPVTN